MLNSDTTRTRINHETFTITFTRTFSAPRAQVFDAWTKPEHVKHWWDPTGAPLSECLIDLRPGGAFKFTNQDSAHSPPFAGVYRVVDAPAELVFDALGAVGTVKLNETQATTRMEVSIRCSSAEHLEQFLKLGVAEGTGKTLDNLVRYLTRSPSHAAAING